MDYSMIRGQEVRALADSLVGEYGDVFWSLTPSVMYVAGTELFVRIYVGNPTDVDREYMLMVLVSRAGRTITEFPIKVDDGTWFEVGVGSVVNLPGVLKVGYTDVALSLNLYEKEQNDIVDSVSTGLSSVGTAELPPLPGFPGAPSAPDTISSMMSLMIAMMMIVMMMKMMKEGIKE